MILGAVPACSVRASGQLQWRAAVRACPAFAGWRVDRWESLLAVAKVLADWMDWRTSTTRPTWAVIQRETGLSRKTVARRIRDLHEAGLLGTVATGRSAGTDPLDPDAGAMAALYVLAVPHRLTPVPGGRRGPADADPGQASGAQEDELAAGEADDRDDLTDDQSSPTPNRALTRPDAPVDQNDTPSLTPWGSAGVKTPARARDLRDLGPAELVADGPWWKAGVAPITKQDRFFAAAELCRLDPVLRRLSVAWVAALCRDWHLAVVEGTTGKDGTASSPLAGWSVADIAFALNHRPDGTSWPHQLTVADVRHVPGFFRYRMSAWRTDPTDPTSRPGLSPSQRAQRSAAATAAAHAAHAATDQATRAAAVPPAAVSGWEHARTEQAARAAAARARTTAAARRLTLVPSTEPAPGGDATRAPGAAARRAIRAGSGLRPAPDTADPRIAALRAAARAR